MGKKFSYAKEEDFKLAKLLLEKGMSNMQVGKIINKHPATISKWREYDSLKAYRDYVKKDVLSRKSKKKAKVVIPEVYATNDPMIESIFVEATVATKLDKSIGELMSILKVTNQRLSDLNENIQISKKWWTR